MLKKHGSNIAIGLGVILLVVAAVMYYRMPKTKDGADDKEQQDKNKANAKYALIAGVIIGGAGAYMKYKGSSSSKSELFGSEPLLDNEL